MNDKRTCKVIARWDAEADVWVATSVQVRGLVVSAPDEKQLVDKLRLVIPDLLTANEGAVNYDAFGIDYIRQTVETLKAA